MKKLSNEKGIALIILVIIVLLISIIFILGITIIVQNAKENNSENTITENVIVENSSATNSSTNSTTNEISEADIDVVDASLDNPAEIGEWFETYEYSAHEKEYQLVYVRVTDIITGDKAQEAIDLFNADEDNIYSFSDLKYDELEYALLEYEVYFPETFSSGTQFGGYNISILSSFGLYGLDGETLKVNGSAYIGLGFYYDVTDYISTPYPDVAYAPFSFTCYEAFSKVENCSDYLIKFNYLSDENGDTIYKYVKGE